MNSIHPSVLTSFETEQYQVASWTVASNILHALLDGTINGYSLSNFLQNDSDYITKMIYFPIKLSLFYTSSTVETDTFRIGQVPYLLPSAQKIDWVLDYKNYIELFSYTATPTYNSFLDYEPYTAFSIKVPFFDKIDIPCIYMYSGIKGYLSIDFGTGRGTLYITDSTGAVVYFIQTAQIGIPLPIGSSNAQEQARNNILQAINIGGSVIGAVGGAVMGNPLITMGSIGLATKNVTTMLQNNVDRVSVKGSSGGRDSLVGPTSIILYKESIISENGPSLAIKGKPCKDNLSLSAVTGYTEIGEIHFNPNNTNIMDDEISEIIELMHTGIIL